MSGQEATHAGDERARLRRAVTALREVFVAYGRIARAQADMATLHERDNGTSEGGVMTLIGEPRSGKTKLLRDYASRFPHVPRGRDLGNGVFADRMEALIFRAPGISAKIFLERLLAALTGASASQVARQHPRQHDVHDAVVAIARKVGLRLVLVEEAHQGFRTGTKSIVEDTAAVLKDLTNDAVFSIVISGTPEARRLVQVSPELAGRVLYDHELTPLNWDTPDERGMFLEVVSNLDRHLSDEVFGRLSGLDSEAVARPLLVAGRGHIGNVARLIEVAGLAAVDDMLAGRCDRVTPEHLAAALVRPAQGEAAEQANFVTRARGRTRRSNRDVEFKG